MAFTWTSTSAVKGEPISAASVNEVRDLLNTMYSQVNCSSRNTVVQSSDNSGYDSSKDSSIVACTTVYSSRNSSYCTSVNASQTTTTYAGNDIGCTGNNGSQWVSNTCDSHNGGNWSNNDSTARSSADTSEYKHNNYERWCSEDQHCAAENSDNYFKDDWDCSSANDAQRNYHNDGNYRAIQYGDWSSDQISERYPNKGTNYTGTNSGNACSSQNSSRYGSRSYCPSYNNAKYSGKNSSHRDPYYSSVRICSTVHANNG